MMQENSNTFFDKAGRLLESAREKVKTAMNLTMVYTYFETGRMIVKEEQNGSDRAEYGKRILKGLSGYLSDRYGKGFSKGNLKLMRRFYRIYSNDQIGETVFPRSGNMPLASNGRKFYLSWSHFLKLMRIDDINERHFYEIEAARNDWSLSELQRQCPPKRYRKSNT